MEHAQSLGQQAIIAATLVARAYRRRADEALAGCGLSVVSAWPVLIVGRNDGIRQNELAALLGIEGPSLVRTLDRVEEGGLLVRRPDAKDGRAKTLHLTADGRRMRAKIERVLQDLADEAFGGITEKDLLASMRVFAQLDRMLIAMPAPATSEKKGYR
ncbi:MarR family winged helix-turn-helix transcriptional regulator [Variovorax sp. VNK109]|jgi:MarR family transcriptional regulator for hemolysin|uniref:MarR family winged helix-turn-helix transcriptional regulator n=1 Tax=Variovorax sp. VNK109 TaxID=3400919 RepID=UPI003C047827